MNALSPIPVLCTAELDALAAAFADPAATIVGSGSLPFKTLLDLSSAGLLVMPAYYDRDAKPWPVSRRGLFALRAAGLIAPVAPLGCVAAVVHDGRFIAMEGAPVQDWRPIHDAYPYAIPVRGAVPADPSWTHVFTGHDGPGTEDWFYLLRLPAKTIGTRVRCAYKHPGFSLTHTEGITGVISESLLTGECPSTGFVNSPYVWITPDPIWNYYWKQFVGRLDELEIVP